MKTALKYPDIAVGSDMHSDDLSPFPSIRPLHAGGKGWPICYETIGICQRGRFGVGRISTILSVRCRRKRGNENSARHQRRACATCRRHPEPPSERRSYGEPSGPSRLTLRRGILAWRRQAESVLSGVRTERVGHKFGVGPAADGQDDVLFALVEVGHRRLDGSHR